MIRRGCFSGESQVYTTQCIKYVRDLKKDDIIVNNDNSISIVKCLVKITFNRFMNVVVFNNGCYITESHPIMTDKHRHWNYASTYHNIHNQYVYELYDIVLDQDSRQYISINCDENIDVIGLGHNICDNKITYHDYFTKRIRDDLERLNGWNEGYIQLKESDFKRCWLSGDIISINI
jgi:hypothetical protein